MLSSCTARDIQKLCEVSATATTTRPSFQCVVKYWHAGMMPATTFHTYTDREHTHIYTHSHMTLHTTVKIKYRCIHYTQSYTNNRADMFVKLPVSTMLGCVQRGSKTFVILPPTAQPLIQSVLNTSQPQC